MLNIELGRAHLLREKTGSLSWRPGLGARVYVVSLSLTPLYRRKNKGQEGDEVTCPESDS